MRVAWAIYTWTIPSKSESELLASASLIFVEANLLDKDLLDEDFPNLMLKDSVLDLELALDAFFSCSRLRV